MKKWKYKFIAAYKRAGLSLDYLNNMGSNGWSLVCVLDHGIQWRYVFKQPVEETTKKADMFMREKPADKS